MTGDAPRYAAMSDDDLVQRALAGSTSAFDALWERHRPACRSLARLQVANAEDAEEVLALLHHRLHKRLHQYRRGSDFRAWVNAVVRNLARNATKALGRCPIPSSDALPALSARLLATEPTPEEVVVSDMARREQSHLVMVALRDMPPALSATAWLFASGHSYLAIAASLDIPVGTVKSRLSAVRRRLRGQLRAYDITGVVFGE